MFNVPTSHDLIQFSIAFICIVIVAAWLLLKSSKPPKDIIRLERRLIISERSLPVSPQVPPHPKIKQMDEKFCHECGSVIRAIAEICPKCGVRQVMQSASGRNRIIAALFALFLGGIGVHKFYLGKVGQGFVYLLFCWTFVPLVISLFEALNYLLMTDGDFLARYG